MSLSEDISQTQEDEPVEPISFAEFVQIPSHGRSYSRASVLLVTHFYKQVGQYGSPPERAYLSRFQQEFPHICRAISDGLVLLLSGHSTLQQRHTLYENLYDAYLKMHSYGVSASALFPITNKKRS